MKIAMQIERIGQGSVKVTLPLLDSSFTLHKGKHINSSDNWKQVIGDQRRLTEPTVVSVDVKLSIFRMNKMQDNQHDKYRACVELAQGGVFGHCCSPDFNISKSIFDSCASDREKAFSAQNKDLYIID